MPVERAAISVIDGVFDRAPQPDELRVRLNAIAAKTLELTAVGTRVTDLYQPIINLDNELMLEVGQFEDFVRGLEFTDPHRYAAVKINLDNATAHLKIFHDQYMAGLGQVVRSNEALDSLNEKIPVVQTLLNSGARGEASEMMDDMERLLESVDAALRNAEAYMPQADYLPTIIRGLLTAGGLPMRGSSDTGE